MIESQSAPKAKIGAKHFADNIQDKRGAFLFTNTQLNNPDTF